MTTRGGDIRLGVLLTIALAAAPGAAAAGERIHIVGSSTVYPFSVLVAEHFAKSGPFAPPLVRATNTSEGFRLFCAGAGADTPDINDASRPMTAAERAECVANGVRGIVEVRIGYDSLVLVNAVAVETFNLTLGQLWRAIAREVPIEGRLVRNPYRHWQDIDPRLPRRPIRLIGPAPGHGTRDALVELVLEPSCRVALGAGASPERLAACSAVRDDGLWSDAENLELVLGKLASDHDAVGILTYSYLEQFHNRIHAATIDGVTASRATISSGAYRLSRPLFIYVKEGHLKDTTGLADYAAEFVSFCAAGAHGYLADEGLVPLRAAELIVQRSTVARLQR